MAIIDEKQSIFGEIGAMKTLTDGFPKLNNLTNSFPSINNDANSLDFVIDLLKTLIGFDDLKDTVSNILTYEMDDIEVEIKKTLKLELKSIVSCGVNPSLPSFVKSTGAGVNIGVSKVDFLNLMRIDPTSSEGKFVYDDVGSGLLSEDFNTFLFNTIQTDGTPQNWGGVTSSEDMLTTTFISDTGTETNILNFKTHPNYDDKTLTDLNNDYIDSISLFGSEKMINNIIDGLFGTITPSFNKSQKQLENEEKINNVLECINNLDDSDVLSDNFFEFSNEEIQTIQTNASNRKQGIRILETCDNIVSSVPLASLEELSSSLSATTTKAEMKSVISDSLEDMSEVSAINEGNETDKVSIKINFIELLLKRLMTSIANLIITPKVISIFVLNYKIIQGQGESYEDGVDFIKKNKNLFQSIQNRIRDIVVTLLLKKAMKELTQLVAERQARRLIESKKNRTSQLLSLVGVPQEVLRRIRGL